METAIFFVNVVCGRQKDKRWGSILFSIFAFSGVRPNSMCSVFLSSFNLFVDHGENAEEKSTSWQNRLPVYPEAKRHCTQQLT